MFDRCFFCCSNVFQIFSIVKKSDSGCLNAACLASACAILSAGFSRGSCTLSTDTIIATSIKQCSSAAANNIRANLGSVGNLASCLPTSVNLPDLSKALTSCKTFLPSRIILSSGGSMKGNASISPKFKAIICKMTADKLVRIISGSVNSGLAK